MDMVFFALKLNEISPEILADVLEYTPHGLQNRWGEDFFAVLGHEHEMHMQVKNAMSPGADIIVKRH